MLAAGCLGVAATFAYWSILRRLIELKRELQEVKLILAPRKPQPSVFLASRERQWPDLSGVWEFDASKADLEAIDIYIRYMGTPRLIRPIFSYAMSRMKVQKARSMAAGFCWRTDCARRFAAQGFELRNDDTEHTALVEIPIPWMGAMKKGPFPLHATLKEAEARRVLITNACTPLPVASHA